MEPLLVLLVDDDPDASELFRHALAKAAFKGAVRSVASASSALRLVDEITVGSGSTPLVMFVDLALPDQHGFELIRQIRERFARSKLLLVALTASNDPADIDGAFSVGADAFVEKYPTPDDLHAIWRSI